MRACAFLIATVLLLLGPSAWADEGAEKSSPGFESEEIQALVAKSREGEELTGKERKLLLESMWEWPAGRGPARDLLADDAECHKRAGQDPKMESAHPLQLFMHRVRCMQAIGWVRKKPDTP